MNMTDIIGSAGVGLILLAYFLGTANRLKTDSRVYYILNIIGAGLATFASVLIAYWPFVVLEGTWTLVSVYGLMKVRSRESGGGRRESGACLPAGRSGVKTRFVGKE